MDFIGPYRVQSPQGCKTAWVIHDEAGMFRATEQVPHRDEFFKHLTKHVARWNKVKAIRSDGAAEFKGDPLKSWLEERGIAQQITAPPAEGSDRCAGKLGT
jgi:hypothetical protein